MDGGRAACLPFLFFFCVSPLSEGWSSAGGEKRRKSRPLSVFLSVLSRHEWTGGASLSTHGEVTLSLVGEEEGADPNVCTSEGEKNNVGGGRRHMDVNGGEGEDICECVFLRSFFVFFFFFVLIEHFCPLFSAPPLSAFSSATAGDDVDTD